MEVTATEPKPPVTVMVFLLAEAKLKLEPAGITTVKLSAPTSSDSKVAPLSPVKVPPLTVISEPVESDTSS